MRKIRIVRKVIQAIATKYGVALWLDTKTGKIRGNW